MKQPFFHFLISFIAISAIFSCTVVKKYKPAEPFIYENTIKIKGNIKKEKETELKENLAKQIEDSVLVNAVSKLPWPKFPWIIPVPVIDKPLRYDSIAIQNSVRNMKYLMSSLGYKSSIITVDSSLKIKKKQQRIKVEYTIEIGRLFVIDSIAYNFSDSLLQTLAMVTRDESLLKKGDPFEVNMIDMELSRLVNVFQNNGFSRFSRENIIALADSSFFELIDPTLDPFEYIQKLSEAYDKKKNLLVDVYFILNTIRDTSSLKQYKIGNFRAYPDAFADEKLPVVDTTVSFIDGFNIISVNNTFDPKFIARQIEIKPGTLFEKNKYSQTLNNFHRLGTWQNINLIGERVDSTATINYLLRLSPAKKQYFSVDFEGSSILNTEQSVQVVAGKVGLAVNFALRNRNIGKKAIQLENSLRTGIEFNDFSQILSGEITLINRLTIPWMETPFSSQFEKKFKNARTIISADFSYVDRFAFYLLRTFNTFLGYEWKSSSATTWQFRPLNFEFTRFDPEILFLQSIQDFPLLLYTYNDGLIVGTNLTYIHNFNSLKSKHVNLIRMFGDESGLLFGEVFRKQTAKGKAFENLFRYIKLDIDYRHIINYRKTSMHFRAFAGYGLAFQTEARTGEVTLPFFKSYSAGGPNSMRGWPIRQLGIGSNIFFDTIANGELSDKYADIRLEANFEYRFNLFRFFGFWMRGAVFTDIGNIWFRNDLDGTLPLADLTLSRFYKDLAVASGVGARLDFSYFLLRFDFGFPLKDPRFGPLNNDPSVKQFYSPNKYGWFVDNVWNRPTFQFAIGYPF
jgi:outer membrane protein insertion porin family